MKFNLTEIYEGWRNHLFPPEHLKKIIKKVSAERLAICKDCYFNSKNQKKGGPAHCTICGCPLIAKSKCLSCDCALESSPKWKAIMTLQQEDEMTDYGKNAG